MKTLLNGSAFKGIENILCGLNCSQMSASRFIMSTHIQPKQTKIEEAR